MGRLFYDVKPRSPQTVIMVGSKVKRKPEFCKTSSWAPRLGVAFTVGHVTGSHLQLSEITGVWSIDRFDLIEEAPQ